VRALLYAFGDEPDPLSETVRVLDEIVTDFIIETCHSAARSAAYSNRQKIKVEDFKFAIRNNEEMLGRVQELLGMDKELKEARKQFDVAEGKQGLEKSKGGLKEPKEAKAGKEGKGKGKTGKSKKAKGGHSSDDDEDL
jgi:transcription initiation factor TFIID subunit 13